VSLASSTDQPPPSGPNGQGSNGQGSNGQGSNGQGSNGQGSNGQSRDWPDLISKLAIPIVAALIAVAFGALQSHLAAQQHELEQQRALDQQRAGILQTYIANMQGLLLNHHLNRSRPGAQIRQVARVQTLTTLRRLDDARRNGIVLQFLQDAHLIGAQDAVINLSNADLSNDELGGAHLGGIDLIGANLSGAHLSGADLSGADLIGADLSGAHLSGADLSGGTLYDANLNGAYLSRANLTDASLTNAVLTDANLNGARLGNATLTGTLLRGATLNGANLDGARLDGAVLQGGAGLAGADLSGADLSYADLRYADLSQAQLDKVGSCGNVSVLPFQGLRCHRSRAVTLTYWYTESPAEQPVIKFLIDRFESMYPSIKINPVPVAFSQALQAFTVAARGGHPPDVLRSDLGWVTPFASQHYLLSIDPSITHADRSDYMSASLRYDEYDGHFYGLPQVTDCLALLYNKAELKKAVGTTSPPSTMAGFEKDAKEIVRHKEATYGFETSGGSYYVLPFLYAFGGGMFGQHNNIMVNSAGSVAGLKFLLKLQDTDKVMPPVVDPVNGQVNMATDFMNGKTAMIFDGPWDVKNIMTGPAFRADPSNLGIARIPACPPGTPTCRAGQTGSPLGGQSYVISADTKHPAEAYKFISFMSKATNQVLIAEANHTLPTRLSAYRYNRVSNDPFISAFHHILNQIAVPRPAIPQGEHLFETFDPYIIATLDGPERPREALNAVAHSWQELIGARDIAHTR
jgi:arabinogalactan oligomer / maltooligosaccharide transport system substrate-binding protein